MHSTLLRATLTAATRLILPLTLIAAALALLVPSSAVAGRSDLLLALLVLATALGIPWSELAALRAHAATVAVLSIAPLVVLAAFAWLLGHAFGPATRDGLLAVGLSSSEVASVGLAALAGADATIVLGAVTGSLILAALAGPAAIGWLAGGHGHGGSGQLLARFALVVLAPLAIGVVLRTARATGDRIARRDGERDGIAALAVVVLVYASLSGARGAHGLGAALVASIAFCAGAALLGWLWRAWPARDVAVAVPGALAIGMRDFAVAAALATQAFGTRAAAVPGVYGVVMLVAGTAFVTATRRRRPR
ncbi:MAG TPA: bile acid:sodium symporter [Solirubrobacteraceae bacterium]|jgi:bile acid:Na+ symporter, BASS family|nr:bile acid:sodium symporter [Solirubrobacteraceae bacterium]